ncbi:MAG: LamG domain-containing protein, partial [Pirellulaceae bacterium]
KNVTLDRELAPDWRHIAAVRRGDRLELFVDGKLAASSSPFDPAQYDLSHSQPLRIGFGANDYFRGKLADVRLYRGALMAEAIGEHASVK